MVHVNVSYKFLEKQARDERMIASGTDMRELFSDIHVFDFCLVCETVAMRKEYLCLKS